MTAPFVRSSSSKAGKWCRSRFLIPRHPCPGMRHPPERLVPRTGEVGKTPPAAAAAKSCAAAACSRTVAETRNPAPTAIPLSRPRRPPANDTPAADGAPSPASPHPKAAPPSPVTFFLAAPAASRQSRPAGEEAAHQPRRSTANEWTPSAPKSSGVCPLQGYGRLAANFSSSRSTQSVNMWTGVHISCKPVWPRLPI